jgi:hypothetical protein
MALTCLAMLLYGLIYRWLLTKVSGPSLLAGILLMHIIVLTLSFLYIPTAIFIFLFPLLFALMGHIILLAFDLEKSESWIQLLFLIPAIVLFSPSLKLIFIVFGLTPVVGGVVLLLGLVLGLLLPLFNKVFVEYRFYFPLAALFCFVIMLIVAHVNADYTVQEPLQSNVQYQVRADDDMAYWISGFSDTDDWSEQFFTDPFKEGGRLLNVAPLLPINAPTAVVKKDTIENNVRKLTIHCQSMRQAISMGLEMEESNLPSDMVLQGPAGGTGNKAITKGSYRRVNYFGLDNAGFDVMFEIKPDVPFTVTLTDRTMGLPELKEFRDYPDHIIPATDWRANTIQIVKKYVF